MAQYDLEVDVIEDNLSNSDLDAETLAGISELLAGLGDDGGVTIEEITGDDTSGAADAEFLTIEDEDGVDIGDTDAAVILAGDGSGSLNIEITTDNNEGQRTVVASGTSDQVSIQSNDNASVDAGDGDDTVTTGGGSDSIGGGAGNDSINAGGGSDSIEAGDGSDSVDGGEGFDEVVFTAPVASFSFNADGTLSIENTGGDTTSLDNVEYVGLGEGKAIIVTDSKEEAAATSLFSILFGETASRDEFKGVKDSVDGGQGIGDIVSSLASSNKFQQDTAGLSEGEVTGKVFDNFLDSGDDAPEALTIHLDRFLAGEDINVEEMLADLAESEEVLGLIGNIGIDSSII